MVTWTWGKTGPCTKSGDSLLEWIDPSGSPCELTTRLDTWWCQTCLFLGWQPPERLELVCVPMCSGEHDNIDIYVYMFLQSWIFAMLLTAFRMPFFWKSSSFSKKFFRFLRLQWLSFRSPVVAFSVANSWIFLAGMLNSLEASWNALWAISPRWTCLSNVLRAFCFSCLKDSWLQELLNSILNLQSTYLEYACFLFWSLLILPAILYDPDFFFSFVGGLCAFLWHKTFAFRPWCSFRPFSVL